MSSIGSTWNDAAGGNPALRFVDTLARGAGQVMFQNNPLTGLLFVVGIAWGAIRADMSEVAIGAVVALVVATVTAMLLDVDQASLRIGLYGFNGILVGAALPTFLHTDWRLWVYLVVGAAVSTVAMLAIANVFKVWEVPALTFPFVLTTWFLVAGAYAFAHVKIEAMGPPALASQTPASAADIDVTATFLYHTLFKNISQVFLINNVGTGIIFVVAILVSSRWSALFALVGSAIAIGVVLVLGASAASTSAGLFGFSAVLTAIALGSVFYTPGLRVLSYAVLGVIFTVIVQGALDVWVAPTGIPTFTAPFVFVTWLFLLPKEKLEPVRHEPIPGGVAGSRRPAASDTPAT